MIRELGGVSGVVDSVSTLVRTIDQADDVEVDRQVVRLQRLERRLVRWRGKAEARPRGMWRGLTVSGIDRLLVTTRRQLDRWYQEQAAR